MFPHKINIQKRFGWLKKGVKRRDCLHFCSLGQIGYYQNPPLTNLIIIMELVRIYSISSCKSNTFVWLNCFGRFVGHFLKRVISLYKFILYFILVLFTIWTKLSYLRFCTLSKSKIILLFCLITANRIYQLTFILGWAVCWWLWPKGFSLGAFENSAIIVIFTNFLIQNTIKFTISCLRPWGILRLFIPWRLKLIKIYFWWIKTYTC